MVISGKLPNKNVNSIERSKVTAGRWHSVTCSARAYIDLLLLLGTVSRHNTHHILCLYHTRYKPPPHGCERFLVPYYQLASLIPAEKIKKMLCKLIKSAPERWPDVISVDKGKLRISFRRTIRVSDNDDASLLPPDLGAFPLYSTSTLYSRLPQTMAAKGGVLFPMHGR